MICLVSEKVLSFQGRNKDPNQLSQQITECLRNDGYKVQSVTGPSGHVIQAQKGGIFRDVISADRCFTIVLSGQPNNFTVAIGVGKWVQNLAVAAAEAISLSPLFLAIGVPEMLWTRHVEGELEKMITIMVGDNTNQAVQYGHPASVQSVYASSSTKLCIYSDCHKELPWDARFCGACGRRQP